MYEPPVLRQPPRPDKNEDAFLYWHMQPNQEQTPSPPPTEQKAVPSSLQNNLILGVFEAIFGHKYK